MRRLVAALAVAGVVCASAAADTVRSRVDPGWNDHGLAWAPDSAQIVFLRSYTPPKASNDFRLAIVRLDGSPPRLLSRPASDEEVWDVNASLSPDGKRLLVTRELGLSLSAIYVKEVASGAERRLTPEDVEEVGGNWSADGSRIALSRKAGSTETPYTERPDGTDARRLGKPTQLASPRYLPGGKTIVIDRYDRGKSWVEVVPAAGGAPRVLSPKGQWSARGGSPDGTKVLLVERGSQSNPTLWIANVDGSGKRILVKGADGGTFSPDGTRVLYTGGEYTRDHGIHVVRLDGRGHRLVVPRGRAPLWSSSGRIAYSDAGPCNNTGIYVIRAEGGQARRLTQDCHITGTERSDLLLGSPERDVIAGLAGADVIRANPGDQPHVYYGENDIDTVDGGGGNDTISGGRDRDILDGGPGNDLIAGGRGADRLSGGPGRDVLEGGEGKDRIAARDGERDVVRCGSDSDQVAADASDTVARDCEHVVRR